MKKIMFFLPIMYIGGTEIAILNLIKKLKNYEIYIGYVNNDSHKSMLNQLSKYATLVNIEEIDSMEVDYFVSCSMKFHTFDAVNKIKRKKTILWVHQILNLPESVLNTNMIDGIDCIVTVSKTISKYLKKTFENLKPKIKTIYNIIDSQTIKRKAKEKIKLPLSKQLNLVTVSRVCNDKGFNRMLVLAEQLKKAKIDFKWFVVGNNYNKTEADNIKKSFEKFKDNFVWFGFINNPHKIVKQCDYSVLLSKHETWGLVLTEAMCLGVPCISTDFEVAYEQIEDGKNGIILSREDTDSYKGRINDILKHKNKYKRALCGYMYNNHSNLYEWEKLLRELNKA